MIKIAMIGAGSIGFTRRLMMDILAVEELRDTEFRFMDISAENLEMVTNLCRKLIADNGLPAHHRPHHEPARGHRRRRLCHLHGARRRAGGLWHDVEIPLKYGVDQCVGDTLGPGGIFYALRTIPVLLDIARDMRELAPNALLLNYSNPMAMNSWAVRRAGGVLLRRACATACRAGTS